MAYRIWTITWTALTEIQPVAGASPGPLETATRYPREPEHGGPVSAQEKGAGPKSTPPKASAHSAQDCFGSPFLGRFTRRSNR